MSFLKDVIVSKVSFVRKAANKRKFLLLKSDDAVDVDINNDNDNDNDKEQYTPMRKEVKEAILQIVKSAAPAVIPDNIVDLLKANVDLKLTDVEAIEVAEYLDFTKSATIVVPPVIPPIINTENKKEELEKMDNATLLKQVQDLTTQLAEISKSTQRRELTTWLEKECSFMPDDINKTVDTIMELASHSQSAAEAYKDTLKKTSAALENAPVLREIGVSTDSLLKSEGDGFDLVKKFNAKFSEIRKSADTGAVTSDTIVNIIKSFGSEWDIYRKVHDRRAKLA